MTLVRNHQFRLPLGSLSGGFSHLQRSGAVFPWHGAAPCKRALAANSSEQSAVTTLAQPVSMVTDVKKSKFIATAWPVTSAPQALQLIKGASKLDASHNCWAYQIGEEYRSSDDGEPGGTAGRPILSAIQGEGLDQICVLVTRYFGGIKLGPGGLIRAYGGAARDCLRAAPKATFRPMIAYELELPYKTLGALYGLLDKVGATRRSDEVYLDDGSVLVILDLSSEKEGDFLSLVSDLSGGSVQPRRVQ